MVHYYLAFREYLFDYFDYHFIKITNYSFNICALIKCLDLATELGQYPINLVLVFV